jgi:hypothetical protein
MRGAKMLAGTLVWAFQEAYRQGDERADRNNVRLDDDCVSTWRNIFANRADDEVASRKIESYLRRQEQRIEQQNVTETPRAGPPLESLS